MKGFLYKDDIVPIAELDGSNQIVRVFVYGSRQCSPDYVVRGATYRIVSDERGSPRLVVDVASGTIVAEMDYDGLGRIAKNTNPGYIPFGFAGGLLDLDTGFTRFGARDYDAATGRWTARDPYLFASRATSLYEHVGNDPINRVDPGGLQTDDSCHPYALQIFEASLTAIYPVLGVDRLPWRGSQCPSRSANKTPTRADDTLM